MLTQRKKIIIFSLQMLRMFESLRLGNSLHLTVWTSILSNCLFITPKKVLAHLNSFVLTAFLFITLLERGALTLDGILVTVIMHYIHIQLIQILNISTIISTVFALNIFVSLGYWILVMPNQNKENRAHTVIMNSIYNILSLNSINIDNSKNFKFNNLKKINIETTIFPKIIKDNFDFLNIDCEGNDFKILKTIDLKKYTPKMINIEVSQDNKKNIYEYMWQNSYEILDIKSLSHIFIKN